MIRKEIASYLKRGDEFSYDGGKTWYEVADDPYYPNNATTTVAILSIEKTARLSMKEVLLDSMDHILLNREGQHNG